MQWHEANVNDFLLGRFCPLFLLPSLPLFLLLLCYPFRVSIGFMFILFLLGRFCPGPPLLWCMVYGVWCYGVEDYVISTESSVTSSLGEG